MAGRSPALHGVRQPPSPGSTYILGAVVFDPTGARISEAFVQSNPSRGVCCMRKQGDERKQEHGEDGWTLWDKKHSRSINNTPQAVWRQYLNLLLFAHSVSGG